MTLDDLKAEGGIVGRRMMRGFYLSIEKQYEVNGTKWWRTNDGLYAPTDRIWPAKQASEFHGVWLGSTPPPWTKSGTFGAEGKTRTIDKLPVAFVLRTATKWNLGANRKSPTGGGTLARFATVGLTGQVAKIGNTDYWETDEGFWLRSLDATKTEPGPMPEKLGPKEKWIDVNLTRQTIVAFEGEAPVFATILSSGRQGHETPAGSYRIREKHIAATMDGDAESASDGPYSIQDVPYIQYFHRGFALHGAFWHSDFGRVKSHGCVNLAPLDAKTLFFWSEPSVPDGWHGVFSAGNKPGTRIVLHP